MKNKKQLDIVNGPLLSNMMMFVWPIMLANILQITFNFADTIVVGNFGSQKALAAVGTTAPITIFFTWGLQGLSMGANVFISRMIGSGKTERIKNAIYCALLIGFSAGTIISFIGVIFAQIFLELLETPADIIGYSVSYLRIYFSCCIAIGTFDFATAALRANGDTRRPTLYLAVSGVLNVLLNLLFVVGLGMNVEGVALATVISQFFACALALNRLIKNNDLIINKTLFDKDIVVTMLKYGIPSAIQNQMFSFSNMIIQSSINSFGSDFVAANTAANAIEEYVYVFVDAFPQASLTFTSQLYGAGKIKKIRDMLIMAFVLCWLGAFAIGLVIYLNGPFFLSLMSKDEVIINLGMYRLRYVTLFLFINGLLDVVVNSIRGFGIATLPTIITLFGVCGFRILYIYTYFASHHTAQNLYLCFPLSWLITLFIQSIIWMFVYQRKCRNAEENLQAF
ncbi:MAG: MATE family efflux transporter [Erysipelotrichaceae bacterium]|nr:MATE family efflux transporter [Erysipelotrichaceae bacterium]